MAELKLPPIVEADARELVEFIRESVRNAKCKGVVIGLSGGLDSATVTKLAVDAIGADNVLNVFMPSRVTPAEDYKTTAELSRMWGTEYKIFDIQPAVDALTAILLSDTEAPLERGNISARCRMVVLYNQAKKRDYIVMGTSNQSELMTGYFTKFGDGACDIVPLASMYKTEVRQLADFIGVPKEIIGKPPTAGLWEGQTDEDEMGITYGDLDKILYGLELGMSVKDISEGTGLPREEVEGIKALVKTMEHKRLPPLRPAV
ncbi:MAG: NAD+ synthase [Thermoplasmatales archaeon]|nr:NAD+ synthase [Thermoplasmatales archaeon]